MNYVKQKMWEKHHLFILTIFKWKASIRRLLEDIQVFYFERIQLWNVLWWNFQLFFLCKRWPCDLIKWTELLAHTQSWSFWLRKTTLILPWEEWILNIQCVLRYKQKSMYQRDLKGREAFLCPLLHNNKYDQNESSPNI